jgi:hypothetical protein
MTRVVNLKHEKYDIYIGRKGHGQSGYFGNPIRIGSLCMCGSIHKTGGSTIQCYRRYFLRRIEDDEMFRQSIMTLKGKTLGCFCKPNPCHGDVIKEYLDG